MLKPWELDWSGGGDPTAAGLPPIAPFFGGLRPPMLGAGDPTMIGSASLARRYAAPAPDAAMQASGASAFPSDPSAAYLLSQAPGFAADAFLAPSTAPSANGRLRAAQRQDLSSGSAANALGQPPQPWQGAEPSLWNPSPAVATGQPLLKPTVDDDGGGLGSQGGRLRNPFPATNAGAPSSDILTAPGNMDGQQLALLLGPRALRNAPRTGTSPMAIAPSSGSEDASSPLDDRGRRHDLLARSAVHPIGNRLQSRKPGPNAGRRFFDNPKKATFIAAYQRDAEAVARSLGVPPAFILGLSAWESAWGHSRFALRGNFFGQHSGQPGQTGSIPYQGGRVATFPNYLTSARSFAQKYGHLVKGVTDPVEFARRLQNSGAFGINRDGTKVKDYVSKTAGIIGDINGALAYLP